MSKEALAVEDLAALPDGDIDFSDMAELGDEFFCNARLVMPTVKAQVTLRIDADVLAWFRAPGKWYRSQMNAVLRAYVATQR